MDQLSNIDLKKPTSGSAPKLRLSDPNHALDIAIKLMSANEGRVFNETKVRGMLDGNQPYSPAKLKAASQSYRTNVNFREAESIHSDALIPYYDLFAEAPHYADVQTKDGNPMERVRWSKVITEELDVMFRENDSFETNMHLAMADMVDFGKGFVFWPDEYTWHFQYVRQSRVLVPDSTPADIDRLELVVVLQDYMVHELYSKIKDGKAASAAGWNVGAVKKAIDYASPDDADSWDALDIEETQREIRNVDVYDSIKSDIVRVANVYVREFDGTISHSIVPITSETNQEGNRLPVQFLYTRYGKYNNWRQLSGVLFYDLGAGTWHSIKGLLVKMHPFIEVKNRLRCAFIDNTFMTMSVLVQPTSEAAFNDVAMQQLGPITILRNGLSAVQTNMTAKVQEGVLMEQYLDSSLNRNLGQYMSGPDVKQRGNPDPAIKVQLDAMRQGQLTQSAVNRTYRSLDHIYREIYRRVTEHYNYADGQAYQQAKDFIARCKERGVPMSAIKNVKRVSAYRNIGNGSPFMRQQSIMATERLLGLMPESGRQNWLDDAISVTANQEMVSRYNPKPAEGGDTQSHVDAVHDVAAMKSGIQPRITPEQNHMIFAQVYLEHAVAAINELQRGANPAQVLAFEDIIGPQIARRIGMLAKDKRRQPDIDTLTEQFKQLAQVVDQLRQQVQQGQQQQQQQQQIATREQIEQAKFQAEQQRENAKVQNDIQRKNIKTAVDIDLKQQKTQASIQQKALTRR